MFKKKCHEITCEECGRPKDIALEMYNEIRSLRSEVDGYRDQIKELLEIMGLRRKTPTEIISESVFGESNLYKMFVKK